MKVYQNVMLLMICAACLLTPIVSAQPFEKSTALVVEPGDCILPFSISTRSFDTITQGETDYFAKYVSAGTSQLTMDLNWGTPSNSLSLTANTPIGQYGPYYDSSDGRTDGRIVLKMSRPGQSLPQGTWNFMVYGSSVAGVEDYSFMSY